MAKHLVFQASINTNDGHLFPPNNFLCAPSSPVSSCVHFFFKFRAVSDYYGAQEDHPSQETPLRLHIPGGTSPSERSALFHFSEAERLYHESLCKCSFVPKWGFSTSNVFFNFTIQTRGWQTLCDPSSPIVAPVIREFYSNLPFRVGTIVFAQGQWVDFGAQPINQIY